MEETDQQVQPSAAVVINDLPTGQVATVGVKDRLDPTRREPYLPALINTLHILPLESSFSRKPESSGIRPLPTKEIERAETSTRPRVEAGLFVGTNWLRQRFASTTTDDLGATLNATRGQALGQSLAFEGSYRLNSIFRVVGGISIARTHTTFRYTTSWDTTTSVNGNIVPAVATRKVTHNNFQTLVAFPFLLEASTAIGRFETGLAAGGAFTLVSQQTGRSLNTSQEVVSFGGESSAPLPIPKTYFALMLRPQLTYRLSHTFSLQARADLRWQQYQNSALSGLDGGSVQIGGSVGVLYGFGRARQ